MLPTIGKREIPAKLEEEEEKKDSNVIYKFLLLAKPGVKMYKKFFFKMYKKIFQKKTNVQIKKIVLPKYA